MAKKLPLQNAIHEKLNAHEIRENGAMEGGIKMALVNHTLRITMAGDPTVGIPSLNDTIELKWDLDEYADERERVRSIIAGAWKDLYDEGSVDVVFDDECPDCLGVGYHKPSCPNAIKG